MLRFDVVEWQGFALFLEEYGGLLRKYELVWILGGDVDEEHGTESIEKITSLVIDAGGEVTDTDVWGKRALAYPINKNSEGYYLQANFEIDGPQAQDFERAIYADQSIIRHLLVRDENPVAIADEEPEQ
ncbi:MAG: 30S ribosomal protein S6 [Dehalococcoidia bacterium]|nr:30S ribosomal protein S6 [Dehalococcoidia bacterium]